jgi:hypothetical protein
VPDKILQAAHVALVTPRSAYEDTGVAFFSGLVKKRNVSERVVARLNVDKTAGSATIQVNCDDAMLSATLLDVLKRGVNSSYPVRKR